MAKKRNLDEDVAAALEAAANRKAVRPNLGPHEWEQLAQYIADLYTVTAIRAVQGEQLVEKGLGGLYLANTILFQRVQGAVVKHLAHLFRTGKNGPWNVKTPMPKGEDYEPSR